jgi:hypothetical protein
LKGAGNDREIFMQFAVDLHGIPGPVIVVLSRWVSAAESVNGLLLKAGRLWAAKVSEPIGRLIQSAHVQHPVATSLKLRVCPCGVGKAGNPPGNGWAAWLLSACF